MRKHLWAPKVGGEIRLRAKEISERLVMTAGAAAEVYNDLAPNGRKLSSGEATKAREQLVALSICLRDIHDDDDIISLLVADGQRIGMNADLRPTISLMRMMQRGLGLALSDAPSRRKQAMPLEDLGKYAGPVAQFWRGL